MYIFDLEVLNIQGQDHKWRSYWIVLIKVNSDGLLVIIWAEVEHVFDL